MVIEKIKNKRAQTRVSQPPRLLEETIDQAPEAIEKEKRRGIARFGQPFEEGDSASVIELQKIADELQTSLLDPLSDVASDSEHRLTDFTDLVDAADMCRDQTVQALLDLRKRLLKAKSNSTSNGNGNGSTVSMPPTESTPRASMTQDQPRMMRSETSPMVPQSDSTRRPFSPTVKNSRSWAREYSTSREASGEDDATSGADEAPAPQTRKSRGSLLQFLRHHRTTSGGHDSKPIPQLSPPAEEPSRQFSTATIPYRPSTQSDMNELPPPYQTPPQASSQQKQDWETNGGEIWSQKPHVDRRETLSIAPDANYPSMPPLSPAITQRTNSTLTAIVPTPNPENDYLGYCKAAWKLQNGDRKGALQKCKETDAWSRHPGASAATYLACTHNKCAFRSTVTAEGIWERAWNVPSKGLKFRWVFLAKSHVTQKVAVKNNFAFQCLFCCFLGEKGKIYHGLTNYLDHISNEHRGRNLGEVILYKTLCINDHEAADDEEFDINLWPSSAEHPVDPKVLESSYDEPFPEFTRRATEANDSLFNEPWNEGLSDFHYGGDMDRTELE